MIQAGLYPNPSFGPNFAQLGESANRLGEAGAQHVIFSVRGDATLSGVEDRAKLELIGRDVIPQLRGR